MWDIAFMFRVSGFEIEVEADVKEALKLKLRLTSRLQLKLRLTSRRLKLREAGIVHRLQLLIPVLLNIQSSTKRKMGHHSKRRNCVGDVGVHVRRAADLSGVEKPVVFKVLNSSLFKVSNSML